jgi:hypothetical protein
MARPTIASLTAQLAERDATIIAQGKALEALRLRLSIAERNNARPQRQLPLHFQRARELAMASGRSVRAEV